MVSNFFVHASFYIKLYAMIFPSHDSVYTIFGFTDSLYFIFGYTPLLTFFDVFEFGYDLILANIIFDSTLIMAIHRFWHFVFGIYCIWHIWFYACFDILA